MTENWRDQVIYSDTDWPEICGHTFFAPPLLAEGFKDNGLVLDLGGSTAPFSQAISHLFGGQSHVVEAAMANFEKIEETAQIRKHHYAIAGETGPVKLWLAQDEYHWGSTQQPGQFDYDQSEEVPGITLADLMAEIGERPVDLLKVDIEGAEFGMFQSVSDDFLRSVSQITIEFHDFMDPKYITPVQEVMHRLRVLGFDSFVFTRRFHGDVAFVNSAHIKLGLWRKFKARYLVKYGRGLQRILSRF